MAFFIPWLVDAARTAAAGTGKSVIATAGWETRGHGGMRLVEVVVGHHTATPESARGDFPSAGVVTNGRAGLAGPLAHYGLGRSGNIYVIAAGRAFHAGASAYGGFVDLNDEAIGIEAEDSGDGVWTSDQLFMYPRLVAACLRYMRRGVDRYASHRTVAVPAGRKIDPTGISDAWMRQQATAVLQGDTDMPLTRADLDQIREMIKYEVLATPHGTPLSWEFGGRNLMDVLVQTLNSVLDIQGKVAGLTDDEPNIIAAITRATANGVDVQALARALAPVLGPMISAGATPDQVEAAIRTVFADAAS